MATPLRRAAALAGSRADFVAALATGFVYLAVMSGHMYSIDGQLMYRQAVSIVFDHSLHYAHPISWGAVFTTSKYGIGLSLLYVPGVFLLGLFTSPPVPHGNYDWGIFYLDPVYAVGVAPLHAVVGAVAAFFAARLAGELGYGPRTRLLALLGYGLGSPALVYARGDFSQPLLGLCLVVGLLAGVRYRRTHGVGALAVASASLLYGVLTRPVEGSFLLPALLLLAIWEAGRAKPPRRLLPPMVLVGTYLVALGLTGLIDWARTGTPLPLGYGGGWTAPVWVSLPGLLLSPARSVVFEFPLVVLAPIGLRRIWRDGLEAETGALLLIAGAIFVNNVFWYYWWGSWSWGSRLLVPAFPLLAVLAAAGAASLRPRLRTWLPAALLLAGLLWSLPGVVTDLLAGYAGTYDSPVRSFWLSGYPPIGAWTFLHHLRDLSLSDNSGVDILWFRLARETGNLTLVVPAALLAAAFSLGWRATRLSSETSADLPGPPP